MAGFNEQDENGDDTRRQTPPKGCEEGFSTRKPRPWDEVIPGIDPETKRMYEKWDEIYSGEGEVPVAELFKLPLKAPLPHDVTDDQAAQDLLDGVLDQLSEINVVVDACDHLSPRELYRYVFEEILRDARVHPDLPSNGIVEHYTTWQWCPHCMSEFDADIEDG